MTYNCNNTFVIINHIFDKANYNSKCWIYPGSHGMQRISDALQNSCNHYFYEVGYRLSLDDNLNYSNDLGVNTFYKYAKQFGLANKSGVEIDEAEPQVSDELPVFTAIGQGTHNFTTVGLARYVTTIANGGTCFDLTLLDKITDAKGDLVKDNSAKLDNKITEFTAAEWDQVQKGMYLVLNSNDSTGREYYDAVELLLYGL